MKYVKIIFIIAAFGIAFFVSFYVRNTTKSYNIDALIKFKKNEHDFGEIIKDKEVLVYFFYENIGKTPLKIEKIVSSCGCTIPVWSKKELHPGAKDSVLVKYDSKKGGKFSKEIFVVYNGVSSPEVLKIKGKVLQ